MINKLIEWYSFLHSYADWQITSLDISSLSSLIYNGFQNWQETLQLKMHVYVHAWVYICYIVKCFKCFLCYMAPKCLLLGDIAK